MGAYVLMHDQVEHEDPTPKPVDFLIQRKETTSVWALFDNGAMVDAMSMKMYLQIKHKLAPLGISTWLLQHFSHP